MKYLLGTDIGTSGVKTILMSTTGELISSDAQEYDVLTPKHLWAEQWAEVWLNATKKTIANAVKKSKVDIKDIKGICISGLYGGSGVPVDKDMKSVRPCLIWMDRRASKETQWALENIGEEKLKAITHNGADPYYGYTKMLWIKNNEPENWAKIKMFLPPKDYVIYHLTGEIATDYSSAGNIGGIFDMNTRTWSEELLHAMDIPSEMMPQRILESSDIVGGLSEDIAKELGLEPGMPVCSGGVDCGAANIGLGILEEGIYAATLGSSMCAALISSNSKPRGENLIIWPYLYKAKEWSYNFAGAATAGAIVKWFRDTFAQEELKAQAEGAESAYEQLNKKAENIPAGSQGLVVLPYFMGERAPLWDSDAKGVIFGLSLSHSRAHIYKAFIESVAYSLRHAMESTGQDLGEYIYLAGGLMKSKMCRQIFADVTGYAIVCPKNDVEANMGDVILAGIGTGLLKHEDVKKWQVLDEKILPNKTNVEVYNKYYKLYRSLYNNLKGDMKKVSEIEALDS